MTGAVSPEFLVRLDALRAEFMRQNEDGLPGTSFNFWFTEEQMLDLSSGYVPMSVRGAMMAALDWAEEDRRRAAAPAYRPRKRQGVRT
jgi:hypothetical protein